VYYSVKRLYSIPAQRNWVRFTDAWFTSSLRRHQASAAIRQHGVYTPYHVGLYAFLCPDQRDPDTLDLAAKPIAVSV